MKKKLLNTIIITLSLLLVLGAYQIYQTFFASNQSSSGQITFILKENDTIYINDVLDYEENQTLWDVLNESYEVVEHAQYKYFIIGINDYVTDSTTYLAIYVNDKYALKGAHELFLNDQDIVEIRFESITG